MIRKKGMLPILISVIVFVLIVVLVVLAVFFFQKKKDAEKELITRERQARVVTEPTRIDNDRVQSKEMASDFKEYLSEKKQGGKITFELFNDETFECEIDEVIQEAPEIKGITCSSDRFDAYFTFDDETVLGTITDLQKTSGNYIIKSDRTSGKITLEEYR